MLLGARLRENKLLWVLDGFSYIQKAKTDI